MMPLDDGSHQMMEAKPSLNDGWMMGAIK